MPNPPTFTLPPSSDGENLGVTAGRVPYPPGIDWSQTYLDAQGYLLRVADQHPGEVGDTLRRRVAYLQTIPLDEAGPLAKRDAVAAYEGIPGSPPLPPSLGPATAPQRTYWPTARQAVAQSADEAVSRAKREAASLAYATWRLAPIAHLPDALPSLERAVGGAGWTVAEILLGVALGIWLAR